MNRIERLIEEMCPDGVPFHSLAELTSRPATVKWSSNEEVMQYIDLGSVDRRTHTIISTEPITMKTAPSRAKQVVNADDVIFGTTRPTLLRFAIIPEMPEPTVASTGFCVLKLATTEILPRFLFHLLGTPQFAEHVSTFESGASYPSITDSNLKKFRCPVPPIEVQREIVAILDKFSRLEAELEAELEARTHQFLANLDLCFDSIDSSFLRPLPSFATIRRGNAMPRKDLSDTGIPAIHYGDIYTRYPTSIDTALAFIDERLSRKLLHISPTDVIVASTSENVEDLGTACVWNGGRTAVIGGHATALSTNQDSLYLAYWFKSSQFQKQKARLAKGTKVIDLGLSQFRSLILPLPPLSEQNRISRLLHSMDVLISDHLDGLPAEIAARRQQYEYYRDRLLTFKELQ
ncbi:restriction endonuclease subunit S [Buchananella felis]|uniref:restriction endonuclease subunit S n=1 Tax=Buchananella felis TaxID=3231492 RepID=UPI0035286292